MNTTVAIVHGAVPENATQDEQDTLVQVDTVANALSFMGYDPIAVPLSLNLEAAAHRLRQMQPAFVFNLVESVDGQGRLIHLGPCLLEALRIPYTGAHADAMFITSNKLVAKQYLRGAGIPTPDWGTLYTLTDTSAIPDGRYIIKSVWEHASVGLSENSVIKASSADILRAALEQRLSQLGGEGFAEMYIDGREFNLALLGSVDGPQVLPPAEIRFDAFSDEKLKIVDYRAKWEEGSFEYHHTPRRFDFPDEDTLLLNALKVLAIQCWQIFNLKGYARVDFRVDHANHPYVLEINANPCLSPDAGLMAAAAQAGLSIEDVVQRILLEVA